MDLTIDKNMIDRDEDPQSAEIERRATYMMGDLWNAPDAANTAGSSAIGSSEACMMAGMAAKWRWRAERRAAGKPNDNPNMVCGAVQRILVRQGVSRDLASLLIEDMTTAIAHFDKHPISVSMTEEESTGYNHL